MSFNTYTPRRLSALGQGYTVFVRVLKLALPLAALVIVGLLISRLSGDPAQKILALPQKTPATVTTPETTTAKKDSLETVPGQIELAGARYEGVDEEKRPYTVTADKAVRAMDAPDSVLFENPLADILLQDKTWVAVKSKGGTFDRAAERLTLKDDVSVFHDSGYEMRLQTLEIDLKNKTAVSKNPLQAQGPLGTIAAAGLSVEKQGDLILFTGPATMTIFSLTAKKGRG